MKWSIHQLQRYRQEDMPFDEMVNLESVIKRNSEIRGIDPVRVSGTCRVDSFDIECDFRLEGTMTLPCARTWEDVRFPFTIESTESFSWDEYAVHSDEDEVHVVEGEFVELDPVLEDLILLEIPLQVYSEKAKDMTQAEGDGWSYMTDEAYDEQQKSKKSNVDPRLAGLADLFDKKDE